MKLPLQDANTGELPPVAYGRSLPGPFYNNAGILGADVAMLGATQWLFVDHVSRIPRPGDYFLFSFGEESVIIVRDKQHAVRGYYNVCRHRGSRVCLEEQGQVRSFVCPYHAWTYDLDGRLRGAAAMPADFDKADHGLRPVHVREFAGLIFLNLSAGTAPDFETFIGRLRAYLQPHGLENAKVAVRKLYPTDANWKLVVENFLECYHCKPAHPTYCSVHSLEKLLAFGAGPGSSAGDLATKFHRELAEWEAEAAAKGYVTGMFADDRNSQWFQTASRIPIGGGYLSESVGGEAVAPLMGSFKEYDRAQTAIVFNPLGYVMASNDYAATMRFTPRGPTQTDVETLWLVRADAVEGKDYDPERLTRVWDVTLREDKTITENNQLGVLSAIYSPGPHSLHETRISDFLAWYHGQLQRARTR
jgi:phenylpropionate dioxygenase-like ring-hydroxylating dioxygenase large terminal subunit